MVLYYTFTNYAEYVEYIKHGRICTDFLLVLYRGLIQVGVGEGREARLAM
jgi:hypothetical protein